MRRVVGELATLDRVELGRGIVGEPHVVVLDRRRQTAHTDAQREPARRSLRPAHLAERVRVVEQLGVQELGVGVRHHDVGVVMGAVDEVDAGRLGRSPFDDRDHLRTRLDRPRRRARRPARSAWRKRVEPAACVPATEAGLDVRDAGQRRRSAERRGAGVRGVPPGPLDQALVVGSTTAPTDRAF